MDNKAEMLKHCIMQRQKNHNSSILLANYYNSSSFAKHPPSALSAPYMHKPPLLKLRLTPKST